LEIRITTVDASFSTEIAECESEQLVSENKAL
jgi:hypothetical protein